MPANIPIAETGIHPKIRLYPLSPQVCFSYISIGGIITETATIAQRPLRL